MAHLLPRNIDNVLKDYARNYKTADSFRDERVLPTLRAAYPTIELFNANESRIKIALASGFFNLEILLKLRTFIDNRYIATKYLTAEQSACRTPEILKASRRACYLLLQQNQVMSIRRTNK
jgi:hypothetical protein